MRALFPVFSRPRDISEFFKVRPWESVPNRRPRAVFVDVGINIGIKKPRINNYKVDIINTVDLREYFSYVRRFWNDITLFIVPDSHIIDEHFRRLDESINYFERVRFF